MSKGILSLFIFFVVAALMVVLILLKQEVKNLDRSNDRLNKSLDELELVVKHV